MPLCPNCSAEVGARDTHCMDCGADLIAAKEKERQVLRETSLAARTGTASGPPVVGAAAGVAVPGERSEDTRIRVFDKHEAERLAQERMTAWVIGAAALVAAIALLAVGLARLKAGGGFGSIAPTFKPGSLRDLGLGAFANATFLGVMLLGVGLGALLIGIGQVRMALATTRAIEQVRLNIKPEIVQVSTFTIIGLYVLAVFCPPVGLIVGLIMWFGRNPDLKHVGQQMTMVSGLLIVAFVFNMLLGLAQGLKPNPSPTRTR